MFYLVSPDVAGGLGRQTIIETDVFPPRVSKLHYVFEGMPDDLITTFPCFLVSAKLRDALQGAHLTGYTLADAETSTSDVFRELHPTTTLPIFFWLQVHGLAGVDDFGLSDEQRLVVSERSLKVLKECTLERCRISPFR